MMNHAQHSRRLFAWLLTLVMLLTSFAMPAYAQADWELLSLRLSWTDANGNVQEAYAFPVAWSEDQSYWVQVTADAPLSALTMNISHPNHAYVFDPADGSTLMDVVDASALDGMSMLTIQAYENDAWATSFNLYVSTQIEMPAEPTEEPTEVPTAEPTEEPTEVPTEEPTEEPTEVPTEEPTEEPTEVPTEEPTVEPTEVPTEEPTEEPTEVPTAEPTEVPTEEPTAEPTEVPTEEPTAEPTEVPTEEPTVEPTEVPTEEPTEEPTEVPTEEPTAEPTEVPTEEPTAEPTEVPTEEPTAEPTEVPTAEPTAEPTEVPTEEPTAEPTEEPTEVPTEEPTAEPTEEPTPTPVAETPIPQGTMINRFGTITMTQTALRTSPEKKDSNVDRRLVKGTVVYLLREELNDKGESWTRVLVDGEIYFVSTSCLKVMSQADSDSWMNSEMATPVPPYTADQLDHPETPTEAPTETPTQVPTDVPTEAPTQVPEIYTGYALTTTNVAIRSQVNGGDETITHLTQMKELVMVTGQEFLDGSTWSYATTLDGYSGYLPDANLRHINSEEAQYYIDQWTEANATEVPTAEPTATPTAEPTEAPTQVPDQYVGYALTTGAVAIRTEISTADSSIITRVEAAELVMVSGQSYANNESWSLSTTLDNVSGYIPDSSLRRINQEEAAYYISKWEEEHPTPTPTAAPVTPEPAKISGYAYTVGDDVYFRSQATTMASIIDVLAKDTVVYVNDQDYTSGEAWHVVQYNSQWGYIRADMLRMMTVQEENAYLDSLNTAEPTPEETVQPYNPESLSSYGYVSGSSVNFRKEANTSSSRIQELKQYALCLVLGTTEVNGVTWYRVSYGGQEGYIHGKYFKHMTMSELETFLESDNYLKGITNNSTSSTSQDYTTGGGVVSAEDQTVDKWTNPNNGLNVSYEPFDPFATPEPIESAEPTETVTVSVEPTATLEPIPTMDVVYPTDSQEQGGSGILGWIIAVVVIALIGGGVYVYVTYTNNKRKAAQRAAARRAQAAQQQRNSEARPYARSAQPNQPRTGTYPNQAAQQARRPAEPQQTYARPAEAEKPADYTASYRSPETAETARPVGRRSAYRAQQTQQNGYTASYRPEENDDFRQDKDNGDFE